MKLQKLLALVVAVTLLVISFCIASLFQPKIGQSQESLGGAYPDSQWFGVSKFTGYQTKADPTKIDNGANATGQNTEVNDGDRISIRKFGYELVGAATTTPGAITSLHTFRLRSGENIMMRTHGTYIEYYEEGGDTWETLNSTSTSGAVFDFADYNINTDLQSYVYFGNAVDNFMRWTGNHSYFTIAPTSTATTLFVNNAANFPASGTIVYCGTRIAYTSHTTNTIVVGSAHACAVNRGVAQVIEEYPTNPKGNIYLNANNRLFIAGIASTSQAVYFSKYADATDYLSAAIVSTSTATTAGIFNLGEGGGAVTGMVLDEQSIYILKKSITYRATLSDSFYTLVPLKPFDGKSQTTGSINSKTVFTGSNGVFFVSPDKQIMSLARIQAIDYPQISPISEIIKPTAESLDFTSSTGIFWRNRAYFSAKSTESVINDATLIFNQRIGAWESPMIGLNPSDYTIYDDGTGENLYFGDASVANVYKITDTALDNELGVTANYRTKRFDFGLPSQQKEINNVFIEGYITANTNLTISMLIDEDGFTNIYTTTINGNETGFQYDATPFNLFGFHPFGYQVFGSSDQSESKKFRVYLNKSVRAIPFYNVQFEFASDGEGQSWEILNYGVKWRMHSQDEKPSLYRVFN